MNDPSRPSVVGGAVPICCSPVFSQSQTGFRSHTTRQRHPAHLRIFTLVMM
jgi:hypothetical protein